MNAKVIEALKTALIVLLLASCVLLAGETRVISSLASSLHAFSAVSEWFSSLRPGSAPSADEIELADAAPPSAIAVTGMGGHHYGVKYNFSSLSSLYSRASIVLSEALGSSSAPEETDEAGWRAALSSSGIFFDYSNAFPLSFIAAWLGAGIDRPGGEDAARFLCVCVQEGEVRLYYASDGRFFCCSTAVAASSVSAIMDEHLPNGSLFAFELPGFDSSFPYLLLCPQAGLSSAVSSTPSRSADFTSTVLGAFEINPRLSSPYSEGDDTVVFVEGSDSLRFEPDGLAVFSGTGARLKVRSRSLPTETEMLECARSLAAASAGAFCGGAELVFTGYLLEDGVYTFIFDYCLGGIRVVLPGGAHAAEISITDGFVASAKISFRSYSLSSSPVSLLPDVQAAASAAGGEEPVVIYYDRGGLLAPFWARR